MSREQRHKIRLARKELADAQMWTRIYAGHLDGFIARVARARAELARIRGVS